MNPNCEQMLISFHHIRLVCTDDLIFVAKSFHIFAWFGKNCMPPPKLFLTDIFGRSVTFCNSALRPADCQLSAWIDQLETWHQKIRSVDFWFWWGNTITPRNTAIVYLLHLVLMGQNFQGWDKKNKALTSMLGIIREHRDQGIIWWCCFHICP